MRIVHLADVHIGVENYGKVDPQTGLSTRLRDFLDTFDEVVSYVLDNRVDLVLFCGDAYKSRDPSQTHQREFAARIARLSAAGIPVFLVVGNHDTPHTLGRASALEIFETLDVANVHIGDTLGTHVVQTADGPIQILAVPWIRRSVFLAREDSRDLTPDQVNDEIQRRLAQAIRSMAEELDPDIPAVLAGHVTVGGSVTGSEQSMMLGRDHVLLKSDVALPQLDYVALGHIHRHQILGDAPLVVYPGSLQRIDFGEEGEDKGFMAFDLDPSAPAGSRLREHGFHKVSARDFVTIDVSIRGDDLDPTATVLQAISGHSTEGAVVRLRVSLPAELQGHLRDADIRAALEDAHYVASISRDVVAEHRARLGPTDSTGLEPREALRRYLESRSVPKDRAEVLIQHAERLMEEEEAE